MKRIIAGIVALSLLGGCAGMNMGADWNPIVDPQSMGARSMENASKDLADCRAYARQVDVSGQAMTGLFLGILGGAAMGAAIGRGRPSMMIAGAQGGGTGGVMGATANGLNTQVKVVRNCMMGRGYSVLN